MCGSPIDRAMASILIARSIGLPQQWFGLSDRLGCSNRCRLTN